MSGKSRWTRRGFLRKAGGLVAGGLAGPYMLTGNALGSEGRPAASERLTLGFIGVGGMGLGHVGVILEKRRDVEIRAVADVYEPHRQRALEKVGGDCKAYNDYQELLARPDIDAVVIATPDHWHAAAAIHACRAGKDVYCEKPLSLTVREARAMVNAARRSGTVFQVGSQQRSMPQFRRTCELVRSGRIGKLQWIRAGVGNGPTCDWEPAEKPPAGLDWNRWLGPAPWADFNSRRFLFTFRWFYDYSGGMMTDWGAHQNDIAQWGNGTDHTGPIRTEPVFAEFPTKGLYETATKFKVKHTYANGVILYTESEGFDVEFHGSDGWIKVNRSGMEVSDPGIAADPLVPGDVRLEDVRDHCANWIDCIRARRRPIADVEIGCRSATVCHLGTIAIRTGRVIEWDPEKEEIINDPSLNRWLSRPYRAPWRV
ncbi:MAG TPA: Gfo/Idh/MocA family oxidoreductase [Phycisphaerae bacterium]|nr:Gfo/Idh/MocA family oxidoreductase [Phycisphaerae bacterium]